MLRAVVAQFIVLESYGTMNRAATKRASTKSYYYSHLYEVINDKKYKGSIIRYV